MSQYTVELLDGRSFGPADEATLRSWAEQGRIPPLANIRSADGTVRRAIDCAPIREVMGRIAGTAGTPAAPQSDDAVSVMIPYRNSSALIGYYTSIAALVPMVGAIAGPVAVWFGVRGLKAVKADPRVHGTAHAWVAIVLGGLGGLLWWAVIALLIVVAIAGSRR